MPQLVQPSIRYKESYIKALQEGFNSNTTAPPMTAEEINTINQDFDAYLNKGKNPEKMYIMLESYRNEKERVNLLYWQLTCESFYSVEEWEWLYNRFRYQGDYSFIFFE